MQKEAYSLPVYSTEDYSVFKKLPGNRELYIQQVKRLEKIITEDPTFTKLNPIKVNERMEVIDGQHRLAAFESFTDKQGEVHPVYFVIVKGAKLHDARAMNAGSKAWTPKDYAQAYAQEGNKEYEIYLSCLEKYRLNHNILIYYLTNGASRDEHGFRAGNFKVGNLKLATKQLDQLLEIGPMYINWPHQAFGNAFFKIVNSPNYSHERFVEQMEKNKEGLNGVPTRVKELVPALNMVYNWGRKDKIDLVN